MGLCRGVFVLYWWLLLAEYEREGRERRHKEKRDWEMRVGGLVFLGVEVWSLMVML